MRPGTEAHLPVSALRKLADGHGATPASLRAPLRTFASFAVNHRPTGIGRWLLIGYS